MNYCPELQNNYPEPSRHPEFISGSCELRMCNNNVNILKLFQTLIVGKIPWKTRHFSRNQKISEKVVNQVRNDNPQLFCHPEFISGSNKWTMCSINVNILKLFKTLIVGEIPKQVRNDKSNQVQHDNQSQVRNDNNNDTCHPEFISGSNKWTMCSINVNILKLFKTLIVGKMLNQVQHDMKDQVRNDSIQFWSHPEFISGSNKWTIMKQNGNITVVRHEIPKQVRNDNKDRVQHDMKNQVRNDKCKDDKTERNSKMNIIKKVQKAVAFTLAETLVVMGIIGVVAALTIPNLNQSTGDREKVAKVKKLYANFEDAFGRAQAVYGPYDEWFNGLDNEEDYTTRFGERFTEFMKTSKVCPVGTSGCVPTSCLSLLDNYSSDDVDDTDAYSFILADGTSVWFAIDQNKDFNGIMVFLDGTKNRAIKPKNAFANFFTIKDNQMYPGGLTPDMMQQIEEDGDEYAFMYMFLAPVAWILQNGNMDYLKVLDTKGKCPNGKYLNWTTNTSCN